MRRSRFAFHGEPKRRSFWSQPAMHGHGRTLADGRCPWHAKVMCGRFTQAVSWEELARLYRITEGVPAFGAPAGGDIFPGTTVALVRPVPDTVADSNGARREIARLHWGFRPAWKKDRTDPINARTETLFESGMWREAAVKRRCVVPADGFYEPIGPKRPKRPQVYLSLPEDTPLSIAALWTHWPGDDRDPARDTFALITTAANDTVSAYHSRMPAMLTPEAAELWLDPGLRDKELLRSLLMPWEGAPLIAREIGTASPPTDAPEPREPDLFS